MTAELGPVLWPKSVTRSFWKQQQVTRFLARTFPRGSPPAPRVDFTRQRLVLAAAGPRSSTGYDVRVVRVTERAADVLVTLREVTPSLGEPAAVLLTSPYRLITIPATRKRVYFTWEGRP